MAEWHELNSTEKVGANGIIEHMNGNSQSGKYPPTGEGIKRYWQDHGGEIIVKAGLGTGALASGHFSPRVFEYVEKILRKQGRG